MVAVQRLPVKQTPWGTIDPSLVDKSQQAAPLPFARSGYSSPTPPHIMSYLPSLPGVPKSPTTPQMPLGLHSLPSPTQASSPYPGWQPMGNGYYSPTPQPGQQQQGAGDPLLQGSLAKIQQLLGSQSQLGSNATPGQQLQQQENQANLSNEQRYAALLGMTDQNRDQRLSSLGNLSQQMFNLAGSGQSAAMGLANTSGTNMQNFLNSIFGQQTALNGQLGQQLLGFNSQLGNQLTGINSAQSDEMRSALNNNFAQQQALAGTGIDAALQREQLNKNNELGASAQNAVSRGLGNTTIADSMRRGVVDDSALRTQGIYDAAQQQKLGILQNFGNQQMGLLGNLYNNQYNTAANTGNQRVGLMQGLGNQQQGILGNYGNMGMNMLGQNYNNLSNALNSGTQQQMGVLGGYNANLQNVLQNLFSDRSGIIQGRTDQGPDMSAFAALLSQPGSTFGMNQPQPNPQSPMNSPGAQAYFGTGQPQNNNPSIQNYFPPGMQQSSVSGGGGTAPWSTQPSNAPAQRTYPAPPAQAAPTSQPASNPANAIGSPQWAAWMRAGGPNAPSSNVPSSMSGRGSIVPTPASQPTIINSPFPLLGPGSMPMTLGAGAPNPWGAGSILGQIPGAMRNVAPAGGSGGLSLPRAPQPQQAAPSEDGYREYGYADTQQPQDASGAGGSNFLQMLMAALFGARA